MVRRSFYRIIRRVKTFEKDIFHPSSKRNRFLELKVTFDRSTSGKIFTRQVMGVLQLHAEVTSFRRKKKIYWDHSGKIIPFSFSQSEVCFWSVMLCFWAINSVSYSVYFLAIFNKAIVLAHSLSQFRGWRVHNFTIPSGEQKSNLFSKHNPY